MSAGLQQIARQALCVRLMQRKYFKTKDRFYLLEAIKEEKRLDDLLKEHAPEYLEKKEA